MTRKNPFEEIERMFDRISSQFEEFEPERALGGDVAVDLVDTGDAFEVVADLPGYAPEDIEVTLPDTQTVRISASQETPTEEESDEADRRYLRRERHSRAVSRTVSLPERVDEEGTTASHDNGVLTVTLPKQAGSDGTDIPVN
jgi:HSP20 family protein